ncbi:hypothetical protein SDC9_203573 [bioreactor metagenome]|uniref:Uncharacterized protein n=1 Tax=bioreactor metagenome TaxID=1076179 RepID=A0A645IZK0_9ZZZZ
MDNHVGNQFLTGLPRFGKFFAAHGLLFHKILGAISHFAVHPHRIQMINPNVYNRIRNLIALTETTDGSPAIHHVLRLQIGNGRRKHHDPLFHDTVIGCKDEMMGLDFIMPDTPGQ